MLRQAALIFAVTAVGACAKGGEESKAKPGVAASDRIEQTDMIVRGGKPATLLGPTLNVGDAMPDIALLDAKLEPVKLATLKGKVIVLSVVPSIDTRVCETQTHKISDAMAQMPPDVQVFTVSRDLPYAQTRFAEEAQTKTTMASDYRDRDFGRAFGLDIKETGLLARSVWVIGKDGKIAYREIVSNQSSEPDYEALMAAVKQAAGA